MNSSIAISRWNDGAVQFHVSGKVEASTESLTTCGCSACSVTCRRCFTSGRARCWWWASARASRPGTFVVHPEVRRIVICEMEPLIPTTAMRYFGKENHDVLNDKRVEMVYDDARHYVLTTREKFDIITSDPIHPWVKGSATLYSSEYFELVKQHLNPGGIVTQWVPLYESDAATVKSEIATFFSAFPHGTIWANENEGGGYEPFPAGPGRAARESTWTRWRSRLARPDHARVVASLSEVGFRSAIDLLSTYAGQASDLQPWLKGAEINRDGNLRLQFLAGMALNTAAERHHLQPDPGKSPFPREAAYGFAPAPAGTHLGPPAGLLRGRPPPSSPHRISGSGNLIPWVLASGVWCFSSLAGSNSDLRLSSGTLKRRTWRERRGRAILSWLASTSVASESP